MDVSPLNSKVQASELPLDQLAKNQHLTDEEKVGEVSRQFEAIMLRQILKDVNKSVIKSDLLPEATGSDIYQDMVTNQLAESISRSGAFGFAQSLEHELSRQVLKPVPKANLEN